MDSVSVVLASLTLALAGVVYFERAHGLFAPADLPRVDATALAQGEAAAPRRERRRETSSAERRPKEASDFRIIVERPLFSPGRRPPAVRRSSAPPPSAADPMRRVRLVGMVQIAERRFAILEDPEASSYIRLAVGDRLHGWRLRSVADGEAILSRQEPGRESSGDERRLLLER